MKLLATIVVIAFSLPACRAQFGTAGVAPSTRPPLPDPPPPDPKPNAWPDGFIKIVCAAEGGPETHVIGVGGVLSAQSARFAAHMYDYVKYADDGWLSAEITFPGYDATKFPNEKPEVVQVEYYNFLRPDWHAPENFFELRRVLRGKFDLGSNLGALWRFTDVALACRVVKADL